MARMSVDDSVARDPRITLLASVLGWTRREVVGCLVCDVWPICYDQKTWLVSERVVDAAAAHVGFAAALIECELATRDRSGRVQIKGAKERIKYLEDKSSAGRQGGLKSAESRRKAPKQTSSTDGSTPQAARNPPSPSPVPDPSSVLVPDPDPAPAQDMRTASPPLALDNLKSKVDDSTGKVPDGYRDTIADFDSRYQAAYGSRASWGKRQGGQIKTLLRAHGAAEVRRRIGILFDAPPSWLKGPYDLGTLVQHFDKLVVGAVRNKTTLELQLDRVAMLEAQEAEQKALP